MPNTIKREAPSRSSQRIQSSGVSYRVEYQPQLFEETVLRAIVGHQDEKAFRGERDAIYGLAVEETREERFLAHHQRWFERLGLSRPIDEVLDTWPILKARTDRCLLVKAQAIKTTGAELFVSDDSSGENDAEMRSIVIQLTAEMLLHANSLHQFLRRELLHIVDMLDPEFGYQPHLPKSEIGPTYDRLLQERYRILWDITIDGRLQHQNLLPVSIREKHWQIFSTAFSGTRSELRRAFASFFCDRTPKHEQLVSFTVSPENWLAGSPAEAARSGLCPLCHFPSYNLVDAGTLPPTVIQEIREAHELWRPSQPVCQQCADLYELRQLASR